MISCHKFSGCLGMVKCFLIELLCVSVCIKFLTKFANELDGSEKGPDDVRKKLMDTCKKAKGKDHRFVSDQ